MIHNLWIIALFIISSFGIIDRAESFIALKKSPFGGFQLSCPIHTLSRHTSALSSSSSPEDEIMHEDDESIVPSSINPAVEKAWKYVKKPLLRVGAQGVAASHGNSLRELLNAHTIVKVKVNSISIGSLEQVFYILKDQAEKAGATHGIELLLSKASANTILIGQPGSLERINKGEFPPPPPPPFEVNVYN